jgi:hypothetical protein
VSDRQVVVFVNTLIVLGGIPVFLGLYSGPAWLIGVGLVVWVAAVAWVSVWARTKRSASPQDRAQAAGRQGPALAMVALNLAAVAAIVAGGASALILGIDALLLAAVAVWAVRLRKAD